MNQVADRKKLRREYLGNKIYVYLQFVLVSVFGLASFALTIVAIRAAYYYQHAVRPADHTMDAAEDVRVMITICLSILTGVASLECGWKMPRAYKDIQIPYIPPVTASALPAEEILVRASTEPPVAQSDVLLRAAKGQETPKEELLRVAEE